MEKQNIFEKNPFEKISHNSKPWLITFVDLFSLMLVFFVMLYSISTIDIEKWKPIVGELSGKFYEAYKATDIEPIFTATAAHTISKIAVKRAINLSYLTSVLEEHIEDEPNLTGVYIHLLEDRLVLSLPSDMLFAEKGTVLNLSRKSAIFELGLLLTNISNQIAVVGHTDTKVVNEKRFASNWEFSIARAAAVANTLKLAGYSDDIIILGRADKHFLDLNNLPKKMRFSVARRVDIVILPCMKNLQEG